MLSFEAEALKEAEGTVNRSAGTPPRKRMTWIYGLWIAGQNVPVFKTRSTRSVGHFCASLYQKYGILPIPIMCEK